MHGLRTEKQIVEGQEFNDVLTTPWRDSPLGMSLGLVGFVG